MQFCYASNASHAASFSLATDFVKVEFEQDMHQVRAWREHRRLSQDRLAQLAGISKPYLSQIESGKRRGSTTTLRKIADALGVPVSVLLNE